MLLEASLFFSSVMDRYQILELNLGKPNTFIFNFLKFDSQKKNVFKKRRNHKENP